MPAPEMYLWVLSLGGRVGALPTGERGKVFNITSGRRRWVESSACRPRMTQSRYMAPRMTPPTR